MRKTGFTMIPNSLLLDERLSNDAKLLFCYIRSLSPNYRTLRNSNLKSKLGLSINTLQKCKEELVKHKYLVIKRLSSANYYDLRLPKNRVVRVSNSTQSAYPKTTQYYKDNTINNNTIINKGSKRFKKLKGFKSDD